MWLLVFFCVSVGGVPINPTQNDTSHPADNVTSVLDGPQPATTEALKVVGVPLNDTHNATSHTTVVGVPLNDTKNATSPSPELDEDEKAVQEGDILVMEDRNAVQMLWQDAVVPYFISNELADREGDILTAFRMISDVTCIRFKPRTTEFSYLKFINGKGCASFVGCQGGDQPVYYSRSCSVGNICHEIIHALGLHHEHTRTDRDQFITVQWESIIPGRKKNFKIKNGNTLNLPYDIDSIMHYGTYFFSQNGGPTMLAKQGGDHMGQRTHLSYLDIQKLNRLYHCDERMRGK
ncbi:hatching enzyme 1.2-like [Pempheris klunzingeri]|uniref:hatching enzyme 1.2-like n=1 Tax=Pempheris klunzingeri TaxID=3127111 RepID=UPI00398084AF